MQQPRLCARITQAFIHSLCTTTLHNEFGELDLHAEGRHAWFCIELQVHMGGIQAWLCVEQQAERKVHTYWAI